MKNLLKFAAIFALISLIFTTGCKDDEPDIDVDKGNIEVLKSYMVENDLDLPDLLNGWVIPPKMQADGGIVADDYTIPGYHVFDIRSADEFNAGHIKGAMRVDLANVLDEAPNYADKPILVVCKTGQTAGRAVMALRLSGYPDAKVMKFGMSYWNETFDIWTAKCTDDAVGNPNWNMEASEALPVNDLPAWEITATDGATILAERVEAMLGNADWGINSDVVLAAPTDYSIYNFWSNDHYLEFGHYVGAYQIKPISIANDVINAFPTSDEFMVYCYTGQTSSFTTAWLHVLGYNAKSIKFGVNSLSHTALEEYVDPETGNPLGGVWHHSHDYEYQANTK